MGKMGEGFYRGIEPVGVVSVSNSEGIRERLHADIERGSPAIPMLRRREIPPPILLKYAGVKSWPEFEKGLLFWTIKNEDGVFQIAGQKKQPDRMWRDDPDQLVKFPPGASVDDVVDRMIAIVQQAARKPS